MTLKAWKFMCKSFHVVSYVKGQVSPLKNMPKYTKENWTKHTLFNPFMAFRNLMTKMYGKAGFIIHFIMQI